MHLSANLIKVRENLVCLALNKLKWRLKLKNGSEREINWQREREKMAAGLGWRTHNARRAKVAAVSSVVVVLYVIGRVIYNSPSC